MGRRISYEALDQSVNKFSSSLRDKGIKKGDKVILFLPNVLEFVISYFAVQRIGAIVVPINAKLMLEEVNYIVDHADASAIIVHELLFEAVTKLQKPGLKIKTGDEAVGWLSFEYLLDTGSS